MSEPVDVFADGSTVTVTAFGSCLTFSLDDPHAPSLNPPPPKNLVTMRLSNEHLKVLAFLLWRQVRGYEYNQHVTIEIPTQVLSDSGIPIEDWEAFWR